MATATKFLFGTDFRQPAQNAKQAAAVAEAESRGYLRGLADGQRQVEAEAQSRTAEAQARLSSAMEKLAQAASILLAGMDDHRAETEALAIDFGLTLGRKLAGQALARDPLPVIADAAAQTFQHLRGVPHLVVRVNDALIEAVDPMIQRMARERGFDGRIVILGEPDIAIGDVRLEWADGGVARDQARIEQAVSQALQQAR
jgi:flagellar assembly protein FliH